MWLTSGSTTNGATSSLVHPTYLKPSNPSKEMILCGRLYSFFLSDTILIEFVICPYQRSNSSST
jgi:hypothetical protein